MKRMWIRPKLARFVVLRPQTESGDIGEAREAT